AAEIDVGDKLVLPGFVDTHIHLDKACLLGRCGHDHGSVAEAIAAVAAMKRDFTVEDIYARGAQVIERAVVHGTTRMRTHVEFDLDPSWWHLEEVCRQTERRNYQGRVAIGHATKLSALPPDRLKAATAHLAKSGVAVTVLPATDLYLMGRDATHNAPRGLTVA